MCFQGSVKLTLNLKPFYPSFVSDLHGIKLCLKLSVELVLQLQSKNNSKLLFEFVYSTKLNVLSISKQFSSPYSIKALVNSLKFPFSLDYLLKCLHELNLNPIA